MLIKKLIVLFVIYKTIINREMFKQIKWRSSFVSYITVQRNISCTYLIHQNMKQNETVMHECNVIISLVAFAEMRVAMCVHV